MDNFNELRALTKAVDNQDVNVDVDRIKALLAAYDIERQRRLDLERTLADLDENDCRWSEASG